VKTQAYLFMGISTFFAVVAGVYMFWARQDHGAVEWVGATVLVVAIGFGWMMGWWLWQAARRSEHFHGLPAEERLDGEIAENAGEYGFFSPYSWWPLFVALSVAFGVVGVAVGWWMALLGAFAIILTTIGWVFEYYRKEFQH